MFMRWFSLIALGYVLGRCDASWAGRQSERRRTNTAPKPADVTTWEGEGGAVPSREEAARP